MAFLEPMGSSTRWQTLLAMTSLTLVLEEVAEPVWKMSTGK